MAKKEKLVLIGNGPANIKALEHLLALAPDRYDIRIFGAEQHAPYDRVQLSAVLAAEKTKEAIRLQEPAWFDQHKITMHLGTRIADVDRVRRLVFDENQRSYAYDRLLLGCGSNPIMLDLPGKDLGGVLPFRTLTDIERMLASPVAGRKAVVIGGGLLGLEAAHGLEIQGFDVTLVHLCETLMEMQLDPVAGAMLRGAMESRKIKVLTQASTTEVLHDGQGRVAGIRLKDGRQVPADLVVMSVGIRPNIELAQKIGLACKRGILVDDYMGTSDPHIDALGECAEHRGKTFGLVAPLFEMGKVWAGAITQHPDAKPFEGTTTATRLKVSGIDLFSMGRFNGGPECEELVLRDSSLGIYKKLVLKKNTIVGGILYGDVFDAAWYRQLMLEKRDIGPIRDALLFGPSFAQEGADTVNPMAAMPAEMEVCGCNGVCKGSIEKTILEKGLTSLDEVRAHTKASASCGSCTPQVSQILEWVLGEDAATKAPAVETLCGCTSLSQDAIRQRLTELEPMGMSEAMAALGWNTLDGCKKCRPALNYFLLCAFPDAYRDDIRSRFVNERVHANIQKDGTFSVVPRIFGGMTNPDQLRAIADVADKFSIPTVKITGGQRIDLLGVAKQDLPAVWADLNAAGMVSGHAYGKAVRTVKTCVGSEWCRFGVQDSTGMGVALEHQTWGSWTPHKVKLAVSGCPRNCAEATIKDIGVVAVDSGWEIYVGGNGGMKVRVADFLVKAATPEAVMETCCAFLQLYREEARYLERTAPWIERVGMPYVTERIVSDAAGRAALFQRFRETLDQTDPWSKQGVTAEAPGEFRPVEATPYPMNV
ncbi:nitrite reductase large subunit NirB [Acanthopleuribacter pedis]|uniref:NAD(P)/FAD-dependent oxidoreductase n=1 Tax=Acanthopleuribacter pedis TaxID=442870 RepID=A0A8J7QAJ8_9BACT|nr:nitrite reductase large subunit NirB [Acanthopleuribacter pedis]MBO1321871.1 NAD(P)/FAD-dependent oxidoreductase [Acanthopleuribacter pedis]